MLHKANINLRKVAAMFGVPLIPLGGGSGSKMDLWDGKKVVYSNTGVAWWDKLTSIIRYGLFSPSRQATAVAQFGERLAKAYDPSFLAERGTVDSIEEFANSLQLGDEYTGRSAYDWGTQVAGISSRWANEMWDMMTRSNFGADVTEVHTNAAMAGASLSEGGLYVPGGNNQLFQAMLASSGADVRLSTEVTDITAAPGGGYVVASTNSPGNDTYDEVFWGNPWHLSSVAKGLEFATPIPQQEYVKLHVTYVATLAETPLPKYFKKGAKTVMAKTISTTGERARTSGHGQGPSFQLITPMLQGLPGGVFVNLLFSHEALSDAELRDIFGNSVGNAGSATAGWIHRKEWDAYPLLTPTTSFPPVEPRTGFHYLAAMEPWLSTMETQTVSAREAVARAVQRWWGLGLAQCSGSSSWDLACEPEPAL
jgi:prenylcysteine oxidase/farnesylcysteine lyase